MRFFGALLAAAAALLPATVSAKSVFAHVIVGNTFSYDINQWESDIALAQAAGIDAFVLNIAPPFNGAGGCATQISYAFQAANAKGFKMFFSFDYLGGGQPWAESDVITILQAYAPNGAHFQYNGKPLVSTFEGTNNINDWSAIRAAVSGGITFIPDWTSLGPSGFASHLSVVDGAFSWDMWPDGPNDITTSSDTAWRNALGGKYYMMGVSPWFFTDLPGYNKAWVWRGDDMWHERWQQAATFQPDLVEIVTWNDFGESHYIGPYYSAGVPSGTNANAHWYVDNMPHDAWRQLLPFYIAQYKNGGSATVTAEKLVYWYRLTPAAAGSNGGVTGNDCPSAINTGGYQTCYDPNVIVQDKIFVTALLESPAQVVVQVGSNAATTYTATAAGAFHTSQPFNGQTGTVSFKVQRNGSPVLSGTGAAISASPANGQTNYNAWVGNA